MSLYQLPKLSRFLRVLLLCIFVALLWRLLPYDNNVVLFFRWHSNTLQSLWAGPLGWPKDPPAYPVDMQRVGIIVKTGYGTQERLRAWVEVNESLHNNSAVVLVGDYATAEQNHLHYNGLDMPVHDALAWMLERGYVQQASDPLSSSSVRLQYYADLTAAIANNDTDKAREIGQTHGWELDIMKHVSGLQLGYLQMPDKDWYIMVDDDTYLLQASTEAVLGHLDPSRAHFLGNAVGDYKTRFAHGGSAIVLSGESMRRIFVQHGPAVLDAHVDSLEIQWGDKLVAVVAMKAGVYLNERLSHHFNGEGPRWAHIRADSFCVPAVSLHRMSPAELLDTGRTLKNDTSTQIVTWVDLWDIFQAPSLDSFEHTPFHVDWDFMGGPGEDSVTVGEIGSREDCLAVCHRHAATCLAWKWETKSRECHVSPWMIVGHRLEGVVSGINAGRATGLLRECNVEKKAAPGVYIPKSTTMT